MKKTLIALIGIIFFSCNQEKKEVNSTPLESVTNSKSEIKSLESFVWLMGRWIQLNEDVEKNTFENWRKESNGRYVGHGFVMKENDTIWQEKMALHYNDSIWVLEVKTPGNNDLVKFSLTDYTPTSFTMENPDHDFPKRIKYWKNGNKISALVSGDNQEISFEFKMLK